MPARARRARRALGVVGCASLAACAQTLVPSPLRFLYDTETVGPLERVATTDRKGGNDDFVSVAPGQTVTLLDTRGPGLVRHVWMTVRPRDQTEVLRGLVLRAYWDDEADPSVEAPLGDFFAVGFGERAEVSSQLVTQQSGGLNCYWPMPFRARARVTVTNYSAVNVDALYAQIDLSRPAAVAADEPYFHAHWHRARTDHENPHVLLDTRGAGSYVGTVLSMQNLANRSLLFLEGDDAFTIDDDRTPSIVGTGTEDYFLAGWYFDRGPFSAWTHGATVLDPAGGRVSAFRWHVVDRIPFRKRLRATIEDGLTFFSGKPNADYASVAFYYQTEPHAVRSEITRYDDVRPLVMPPPPQAPPGTFEAEDLVGGTRPSAGALQIEQFGAFEGPTFSGSAYVAWGGATPGAELTLPFHLARAGAYDVLLWLGRAADGVVAEVLLDGQRLGAVSFFEAGVTSPVKAHGPEPLGAVHLEEGAHRLQLRVTGTDPRTSVADRFAYVDAFTLRAAATPARGDH
jgi:hypothetical protein